MTPPANAQAGLAAFGGHTGCLELLMAAGADIGRPAETAAKALPTHFAALGGQAWPSARLSFCCTPAPLSL